MKGFGWMIPGDVEFFALAELDAAREWVSA
jgi:hypothetical protein